jgi:hypothetical protein
MHAIPALTEEPSQSVADSERPCKRENLIARNQEMHSWSTRLQTGSFASLPSGQAPSRTREKGRIPFFSAITGQAARYVLPQMLATRPELPRRLQVWSKVNALMFLLLTIRAATPVLLFILRDHLLAAS